MRDPRNTSGPRYTTDRLANQHK